MNQTWIIADVQDEYMRRLQHYMNQFYEGQMNMVCCSGEEELADALRRTENPMVLIAEELAIPAQKLLWDIPVVILTENREGCSIPEARTIWKYQRIDRLYDEMSEAAGHAGELCLFRSPRPLQLILFQGASGGVGTSTMAVVCARTLAQMGRRVLYLNLEMLGTADFYFHGEEGMDLTGFLEEMEKGARAEELIQKAGKRDSSGVTFLGTAQNARNAQHMNLVMLQKAIGQLSISGLFEYCIIDKPYTTDPSHEVWMQVADQIIFVTDGTETGNLKFIRAYLCMDPEQINGRIRLLYNKVQPVNFRELSHLELPVMGRVEYLSAPDRAGIEQQIGERGLFVGLDEQ